MYYEKNITLLRQLYPYLYEKLKEFSTQDLIIYNSRMQAPTLSIKRQGREIFLHSQYNPQKEAQRQVSAHSLSPGDKVVLFGGGLGYFIPEILAKITSAGTLLVIEPNLSVFKVALELVDFWSYLSNPQLVFSVSDNLKEITKDLHNFLKKTPPDKIKIVIHQPTLESLPSSLSGLEEVLRNIILSRKSSQVFTPLLKKNLYLNTKYIIESPGVAELFSKCSHLPIFVISAGPSLDQETCLLSRIQSQIIIISVGTALRPLLNNEIVPDFVVITDAQEAVLEQFKDHLHQEIPLIFIPTAYHGVIKEYQGKKIVALIKDEFSLEDLKDLCQLKGEIETGGSVATASLDLAIRMEGNPIVLVGQDLSFPSCKPYAQNTYHFDQSLNSLNKFTTLEMIYRENAKRGDLLEIPNIHEEITITHRNLLIYLRWIESRIRREKDKIFINTSTEGAKIKGSISLSLREVYERYCLKKIDKDITLPKPIIPESQYQRWKMALESLGGERL
ncbi:DUF115 domain-containing protein [bacterium]|nr:DUF115 domain-containing protein [bacterium]